MPRLAIATLTAAAAAGSAALGADCDRSVLLGAYSSEAILPLTEHGFPVSPQVPLAMTDKALAMARVDESVVVWGNHPSSNELLAETTDLGALKGEKVVAMAGNAGIRADADGLFCAVLASGRAASWPAFAAPADLVFADVSSGAEVIAMADSCAALAGGQLRTWNATGLVAEVDGVARMVASEDRVVYLTTDNAFGALPEITGDGMTAAPTVPAAAAVETLLANKGAFAALLADGSVVSFGADLYGAQLSQGLTTKVATKLVAANEGFTVLFDDSTLKTSGNYGGNGQQAFLKKYADVMGSEQHFFALLKNDFNANNCKVIDWVVSPGVDPQIHSGDYKSSSSFFASVGTNDEPVALVLTSDSTMRCSSRGERCNGWVDGTTAASSSNETQVVSNSETMLFRNPDGSIFTFGEALPGLDALNGTAVHAALQEGVGATMVVVDIAGKVHAWGSLGLPEPIDLPADVDATVVRDDLVVVKPDGSLMALGGRVDLQVTENVAQVGFVDESAGYESFAVLQSDGTITAWEDKSTVTTVVAVNAVAFAPFVGQFFTWVYVNETGGLGIVLGQDTDLKVPDNAPLVPGASLLSTDFAFLAVSPSSAASSTAWGIGAGNTFDASTATGSVVAAVAAKEVGFALVTSDGQGFYTKADNSETVVVAGATSVAALDSVFAFGTSDGAMTIGYAEDQQVAGSFDEVVAGTTGFALRAGQLVTIVNDGYQSEVSGKQVKRIVAGSSAFALLLEDDSVHVVSDSVAPLPAAMAAPADLKVDFDALLAYDSGFVANAKGGKVVAWGQEAYNLDLVGLDGCQVASVARVDGASDYSRLFVQLDDVPTASPTSSPTTAPSATPTTAPTEAPVVPSAAPSRAPLAAGETLAPSRSPLGVNETYSPTTSSPTTAAEDPEEQTLGVALIAGSASVGGLLLLLGISALIVRARRKRREHAEEEERMASVKNDVPI